MLDPAIIVNCTNYDSSVGMFTDLKGKRIGYQTKPDPDHTYRRLSFTVKDDLKGKRRYEIYEHRAAFVHMTGRFPEKMVDHIDHDGTNNKWDNLRPATSVTNQWNMKRPKNNKSGHIGVHWDKENCKWRASIAVDGKQKHLGRFIRIEDAVAARDAAIDEYRGGMRYTGDK